MQHETYFAVREIGNYTLVEIDYHFGTSVGRTRALAGSAHSPVLRLGVPCWRTR